MTSGILLATHNTPNEFIENYEIMQANDFQSLYLELDFVSLENHESILANLLNSREISTSRSRNAVEMTEEALSLTLEELTITPMIDPIETIIDGYFEELEVAFLTVDATPAPYPCRLNPEIFYNSSECIYLEEAEAARIETERQEAERVAAQQREAERLAAIARENARPATPTGPIPSTVNGNRVLEIAASARGIPYCWGGTTTNCFDCSGFTQWVFRQVGINLPRTSAQQRHAGTVVSRNDARPGDLVWWPGHVAIFAGGNQIIDASRPGTVIDFRNIWRSNPIFIRL